MSAATFCRFLVTLSTLFIVGCTPSDSQPNPDFAVAATKSYVGARVYIDGTSVGQLQEFVSSKSLYGKFLRWRYPESPANDIVSLSIVLDASRVSRGIHGVRVEKDGLDPLSLQFAYPLEKFEIFFLELTPPERPAHK